jgi:hypothetical protein
MTHFIDAFADRVNDILHEYLGTRFFKQEIVEVPGLLAGLLITYDGVRDDSRETHDHMSPSEFLERMSLVKPDWRDFDLKLMEELGKQPHRGLNGWEGRTIYFLKGGSHLEQWTVAQAEEITIALLKASIRSWGPLIQWEAEHLRENIPTGTTHFREYERQVRVIWNFLFLGELGEGQPQSRTDPENEGVEIRDIVFANHAEAGFWKDLKEKYAASEIVLDAKNTDNLTRDDLRQLYCYLKPALGFWGFIVCRSEPLSVIQAFNRTLYQNFLQQRGVLMLCDDDLRRMAQIANRGRRASEYLQGRMSEFVRSI